MKSIELSKKYCMNCYGGNYDEMIKNQDGIIFDDEMIRKAFKHGSGGSKDFKEYMQWNRPFCRYYDLENQKYI